MNLRSISHDVTVMYSPPVALWSQPNPGSTSLGMGTFEVQVVNRPARNSTDYSKLDLTGDLPAWPKSADAYSYVVSGVSLTLIDLLQRYRVANHERVKDFLVQHADLTRVLGQIPEVARNFVPGITGFQIGLVKDDEEGLEYLVLQIDTISGPDEILRGLDRFDFDWWLKQPQSRSGLVVIQPAFK